MSTGVVKVLLTTPTTPTERMKAIVEAAEGFVYLVRPFSIADAPYQVSSFIYLELLQLECSNRNVRLLH